LKLPLKYCFLTLLFTLVAHYSFLYAQQTVFAVVGDFGTGDSIESAVADLVKSWDPQFIITTGDNRYYATNYDLTCGRDYCEFIAGAVPGTYCSGNGSSLNAFFPSTGNHDYTNAGGINEYLSYFDLPGTGIQTSGTSGSERYYDFIMGPVHFFVIDSYDAIANGTLTAQQTWLHDQLASSTARWKIVYFHHAPYSSCINHGSILEMRWPFAQWGADAVLSGHDHTYERLDYDSIPYFVNGLGGATIYSFSTLLSGSRMHYNAEHGAQRIIADDTTLTFSFINTDGVTIDEYELFKVMPANHAPLFYSDTILEDAATEDSLYVSSIAAYASDPDGDSLSFSFISGPAWLSVSPDGDLSGTPMNDHVGVNSWILEVDDGRLGADTAVLQITVLSNNQDTAVTGYENPWHNAAKDLSESLIYVYPNPVRDRLIIEFNGWQGRKNLTLYDISGKVVFTESITSENDEIDVHPFPKGLYLLRINDENLNYMKEVLIL
jgi:hypothetical protein